MSNRRGQRCCVPTCPAKNFFVPGKSFFRIPSVALNCQNFSFGDIDLILKRRSAWLDAIALPGLENLKAARVCSDHFQSGQQAALHDLENIDWVPSIFPQELPNEPSVGLPIEQPQYGEAVVATVLEERNVQELNTTLDLIPVAQEEGQSPSNIRALNKQVESADIEVPEDIEEELVAASTFKLHSSTNETIYEMNHQFEKMKQDIVALQQEVQKLKIDMGDLLLQNKQLKSKIIESNVLVSVLEDKTLLKFYTGLEAIDLFEALFDFVSKDIKEAKQSALTLKEQLLLTLMRLRLNLKEQDLASRFGIAQSTVSRYFQKWIHLMDVRLVPATIKWPDKDAHRQTMPMAFRDEFMDCVAIIDCFESFMDRHGNLNDRASTYSSYKGHNTVKYLIAVSPQGTIIFISKGYGGRASDKYIVQNSGFLELLQQGDVVLADRGFTVEEAIATKGAHLHMPSFRKPGTAQLAHKDVCRSRTISNVRIHVERVIGVLKQKYGIVCGPIPVPYGSPNEHGEVFMDKIARVCCALINCNPCIVPAD